MTNCCRRARGEAGATTFHVICSSDHDWGSLRTIGDPAGLAGLVFRGTHCWISRILMSELRCCLSLHRVIQGGLCVPLASFMRPFAALFRRRTMAFGLVVMLLCGRGVRPHQRRDLCSRKLLV